MEVTHGRRTLLEWINSMGLAPRKLTNLEELSSNAEIFKEVYKQCGEVHFGEKSVKQSFEIIVSGVTTQFQCLDFALRDVLESPDELAQILLALLVLGIVENKRAWLPKEETLSAKTQKDIVEILKFLLARKSQLSKSDLRRVLDWDGATPLLRIGREEVFSSSSDTPKSSTSAGTPLLQFFRSPSVLTRQHDRQSQKTIDRLKKELEEERTDRDELASQLADAETRLSEKDKELRLLKGELKSAYALLPVNVPGSPNHASRERTQELSERVRELKKEVASAEKRALEQEKECITWKKKAQSLERTCVSLRGEVYLMDQLRSQKEELREGMLQLSEELSLAKIERQRALEELEAMRSALTEQQEESGIGVSLEPNLQEECVDILLQEERIQTAQLSEKLEEVKASLQRSEQDLKQFTEEKNKEIGSLQIKSAKLSNEKSALLLKNQELSERLETAIGENRDISSRLAASERDLCVWRMENNHLREEKERLSEKASRHLQEYEVSQKNLDDLRSKLKEVSATLEAREMHRNLLQNELENERSDHRLEMTRTLASLKALEQLKSDLDSKLHDMHSSLLEKESRLASAIATSKDLEKEKCLAEEQLDAVQLTLRKLHSELDEKTSELESISRSLKESETEKHKSECEFLKLHSLLEETQKEKQDTATELEEVRSLLQETQKEKQDTATELEEVRSLLQETQKEKQDTATELEEVRSLLQETQKEKQDTATELERVWSLLEETKKEKQETMTDMEGVRSLLQETQKEKQDTATELEEVRSLLQEIQKEKQDTATELKEVRSLLQEIQKEKQDTATELERVWSLLEETQKKKQEVVSELEGVRSLLAAKEEEELSKIRTVAHKDSLIRLQKRKHMEELVEKEEIIQNLRNEVNRLEREMEEVRNSDVEQRANLEAEVRLVNAWHENERKRFVELNSAVRQRLEEEKENLQSLKENLETECQEYQEKVIGLESSRDELLGFLEQSTCELSRLEGRDEDMQVAEAVMASLKDEVEQLRGNFEMLQDILRQKNEELAKTRSTGERNSVTLSSLASSLERLSQALGDASLEAEGMGDEGASNQPSDTVSVAMAKIEELAQAHRKFKADARGSSEPMDPVVAGVVDKVGDVISRSRCLVLQLRIGKEKFTSTRLRLDREGKKFIAADEEIRGLKKKSQELSHELSMMTQKYEAAKRRIQNQIGAEGTKIQSLLQEVSDLRSAVDLERRKRQRAESRTAEVEKTSALLTERITELEGSVKKESARRRSLEVQLKVAETKLRQESSDKHKFLRRRQCPSASSVQSEPIYETIRDDPDSSLNDSRRLTRSHSRVDLVNPPPKKLSRTSSGSAHRPADLDPFKAPFDRRQTIGGPYQSFQEFAHSSASDLNVSRRSVLPPGAGSFFTCDEEASEVLSATYLEAEEDRVSELQRRNTLQPAHLKSSYPTEDLGRVREEELKGEGQGASAMMDRLSLFSPGDRRSSRRCTVDPSFLSQSQRQRGYVDCSRRFSTLAPVADESFSEDSPAANTRSRRGLLSRERDPLGRRKRASDESLADYSVGASSGTSTMLTKTRDQKVSSISNNERKMLTKTRDQKTTYQRPDVPTPTKHQINSSMNDTDSLLLPHSSRRSSTSAKSRFMPKTPASLKRLLRPGKRGSRFREFHEQENEVPGGVVAFEIPVTPKESRKARRPSVSSANSPLQPLDRRTRRISHQNLF
ncbi:unnamed protein product [Cyprideis torosa]|uniref:Uncharacterized protein n=1 Tax=Cyprideis torosa TaxID=163714 RepID=A0A7R8WGX5_9CRUS|nr:unnamed protein product [Cyprideis torosa]CAG0895835.1 unnamed protein product [Cyprideis torosa]